MGGLEGIGIWVRRVVVGVGLYRWGWLGGIESWWYDPFEWCWVSCDRFLLSGGFSVSFLSSKKHFRVVAEMGLS